MSFMSAFPLLERVSGEKWKLWQKSLAREVGGDDEQLRSYLPMWLKKNSSSMKLPEYWTELADYEWSCHFAKSTENSEKSFSKEPHAKLSLNPFARILRLKFEIQEWVENECEGEPSKRQHVLVVTPTAQIEATYEMAAIIDELSEESLAREELEKSLDQKHGPRGWASSIDELIRAGVVR